MSETEVTKHQNYGGSTSHDLEIWKRIEAVIAKSNHSFTDVLESFPVYIRRVNLSRFLAHYELYKMVQDLPGNIVECGVYRGTSLLSFAKFLEIFNPGDRIRRVYGFDNFAGFESFHEKDGSNDQSAGKVDQGWNAGNFYDELKEHIEIFGSDSFVPHSKRIVLVEGDLKTSAAKFMAENPGMRISLLHLDVDIYEPTLAALEAFYPAVVKGGVVVFDEYGFVNWPGESAAFETYFGDKAPKLQKFPFISAPGAYFIKE